MSASAAARFSPLARLRAAWAKYREDAALRRGLPVRDSFDPRRTDRGISVMAGFDQALVIVVAAVVTLGLVMVYSASVALPESPKYAAYTQTYFLSRHAMFIAMAFVMALVMLQVPISFWEKHASKIFILALILLVVVLIPGVGKVVNRSRRWLPMGVINFQPSELAKLAMVLYAASYMVRKMDVKERFFKAVWPMAVATGVIGLLLLRQPDMGAFIVIATIAMGILFLGGVNARMFFLIAAILLASLGVILAFDEVRSERILAYLDPWNPKHEKEKAWQLTNSLIAFGLGSFFGQGLGSSVEKLHYLPEAHTDFLLAIIGEELGFVGVAAVVLAYFWITRRIVAIGRQAIALDRVFAGLATQGVAIWIGFQSFINMGVNLGLLPTKGLTLPLMSYGGSAMLLNFLAIAFALRVDVENRKLMRGGRA
jgi:cell division protein FtsW